MYLDGFNTNICFIVDLVFKKRRPIIFPLIKEVFHAKIFPSSHFYKQGFFFDKERYPQAKIFPWLKKFAISPDFSFIKEVTFPQAKILLQAKYFSIIKEVFHKPRFLHKQIVFLDQGSLPKTKTFFLSKDFFVIMEVFQK